MAKTRAEILGLEKIESDLKVFVKNIIKDKELVNEIGAETASQIKLKTRSKLEQYKQPELQSTTKEIRRKLISDGSGSEFSKAEVSNLTLSGQLLDSISFTVNEAESTVTIFLKGDHKPYKNSSKKDKQTKTNKYIMLDLEKRGFKFFFISERVKAILQSKLTKFIRQKLSNYSKIKRSLK